MFLDTQPASLDATDGQDPWSAFRVNHPGEILGLMRRLRDSSVPVNLNGPDGQALTTVLWAVDDVQRRVNLKVGGDATMLASMVAGDEMLAVAYLESVKLQFDLHGLLLVRGAQTCALQAAFPQQLLRFQRRGAFRVRTIERSAPVAHVRHPSVPDMRVPLRVMDVSIGGCALFIPANLPPLQPGTEISRARFELDDETRFEVGLRLQHVSSIAGSDRGVRMGCEWHGLSSHAERALQRYIDQTQKRRRLLSLG